MICLCLGIAGRSTAKLNTSQVEMPGANKLEPSSSELKLEKSKTERQRHNNVLAEDAAQQTVILFNNNILIPFEILLSVKPPVPFS